MSKFDFKTRQQIRTKITSLSRKGMNNKAIAVELNKLGFKAPDGGKVTATLVSNQKTAIARTRKTRAVKKGMRTAVAKTAVNTPVVTTDHLIAAVANSNISTPVKLALFGRL